MIYSSLFVAAMLMFLKSTAVTGNSNYHEEDWVDPFDMLNYDRSTKTMLKKSRNAAQQTDDTLIEEKNALFEDLNQCMETLEDCTKHLDSLKYTSVAASSCRSINDNMNSATETTPKPVKVPKLRECEQSKLFMRRFVNILLRAAGLNEDMPENLETNLHITVDVDQLQVLQQFSKGSNEITLQELDGILSSVLLSAKFSAYIDEYIPWSKAINFLQSREMLLAVVLGGLPAYIIWKILTGHSLIRVLMLFLVSSFIISFSITYCRMYKQAEVKQFAMMKKNPEVPAECRPPAELTWMEAISRLFSSKFSIQSDDCQKYYETIMIDPILEITPALVLSEMTASFFLHPSTMIGNAISNFSRSILGNLPFGANYIVLFLSFFLIICIIFAVCGGSLKLPYYLGGMELSGGRSRERITAIQQETQRVQQLEQPQTPQALNTTSLHSLMQAADSSDTDLVVMNIRGMQRLLSSGNTTIAHRTTVEEIQLHLQDNKNISSVHETEAVLHVPGCCGESLSRCCHKERNEMTPVMEGSLQIQPRKSRKEELSFRKTRSLSSELNGKKGVVEDLEKSLSEECIRCSSNKQRVASSCDTEDCKSDELKNQRKAEVKSDGNCDADDSDTEETSFVKL